MADPFAPGSNLDIEIVDEYAVVRTYRTMVYDDTPDRLHLMAPTEGQVPIRFAAGLEIMIMQEAGGQAHSAMVDVVESKPGEPPLIITTRPQRVTVVSRRRFFRVDVDLECEFDGGRGRTRNLSGSGMMVEVLKGTTKEGATLNFRIALPDGIGWVPVRGKVARLVTAEERHMAGVHFTKLSLGVREALIQHVTMRQRNLMRLGLLVRDDHHKDEPAQHLTPDRPDL